MRIAGSERHSFARDVRTWRGLLPAALSVAFAVIAGAAVVERRHHAGTAPTTDQPAEGAARARHSRLRRPTLHAVVLVVVGLAFFSVYLASFPRPVGDRPTFSSPRESIGYYLTQRFLDGDGFSAPLLHAHDLPADIAIALTPRDAANIDGNVVPKDFVGTLLLYAAAMAVYPALALLLSPLFAVIGAWAVLRITEETFDRRAGIIAFLAWLAFPPLWVNAAFIFMGDLPALAFFLLAILAFLRYWREPTLRRMAWMSAFFCASILFRYPDVMFGVPFAAALLYRRRLKLSHVIAAALVALPFAAVVLVFNQLVYGSPVTTGFQLGADIIQSTVHYSHESLFKRRPDVLIRYAWTYGKVPVVSLPFVGAFVAAAFLSVHAHGVRRMLAATTVGMTMMFVAYYGQQDAWGYREAQLNASVLRYLLPAFALLMVFAAGMISQAAARWGRALYLVPAIFIVAAGWSAYAGPGGVRQTYDSVRKTSVVHDQVVAATPPDAVIASRIMDKVLYPDRQTLTLTYAIQNQAPFSKGSHETWDFVPSPQRFADVTVTMTKAGVPVYFLPDGRRDIAWYQAALLPYGYYLRQIRTVDTPFFKVSRYSVGLR